MSNRPSCLIPLFSLTPVATVSAVVISSSIDHARVCLIRDCLSQMHPAFSPLLVNLSVIIDDVQDQIIDGDAAMNEDRVALAANASWPVLLKLLLKDSADIAVGGCQVIIRVSSTGVVADYVCRDGVEFLNARTYRDDTVNRQIIEAKHVSLLNVAAEDVAAELDAAIVWTSKSASEHPPVYDGCSRYRPLQTTVGERGTRHRLELADHVWNADLACTNFTSPPIREGYTCRVSKYIGDRRSRLSSGSGFGLVIGYRPSGTTRHGLYRPSW